MPSVLFVIPADPESSFFVDPDGLGVGIPTLFTTSSLNPGGLDLAGVFPLLAGSGFLVGFELPGDTLISFNLVTGMRPLTTVPEPGTGMLLMLGLMLVVLSCQKSILVWRLSWRGTMRTGDGFAPNPLAKNRPIHPLT